MAEDINTPPDNWLDLVRAAAAESFPFGLAHFDLVATHPYFRRNFPGFNGTSFHDIPLTRFDSILLSLTDEEIARVPFARLDEPLVFQVADGATVLEPVGTSRVALEAHREASTPAVTVRLFWPTVRDDLWWWNHVITYGTPAEREAAFKGTLPAFKPPTFARR